MNFNKKYAKILICIEYIFLRMDYRIWKLFDSCKQIIIHYNQIYRYEGEKKRLSI